MKTLYQILLAVLTGILVCFSFPTVLFGWHAPELGIIGWVALVPLFWAIHNASARKAFLLTFLSAVIWYGASIYWVFNAMHTYGKLPSLTSFLVTVLLVIVVATYAALAPMFAKLIKNKGETLIFLPILWVALELCRNYLPCNGFPWSNLAMSQYKILPAIQIVDIVGVYGLIFAMVWFNCYLVELILWLRKEKPQNFIPKTVVTIIFVVSIIGYGVYKLETIPRAFLGAPNIKIGMIQGNIDQGEKWDPEKAAQNLNVYREDERKLRNAAVDLIIWPEAAYPFVLSTDMASMRPQALGLTDMEMTKQPYTLVGAVSEGPADNFHNSAFLFDAHGRIEGLYHKAHLVPFGEYIPYKKILFFARKLTAPVGNFFAGNSYEPLLFDDYKMGVFICYEDVFPEIARREVLSGAEFLVLLTNDGWFGRSSAPYQHLALSVFRAVENRRFLVRSANSGVSAIIDPLGTVVMESNIFERSVMVAAIAPPKLISPYTKLGNWFAWGCVAYALYAIIMVFVAKFRKKRGGR